MVPMCRIGGFTIVEPQIYIRKETFEKYKKYAYVIQRKKSGMR